MTHLTNPNRSHILTLCLLVLSLTLACYVPIEPRPDLEFDPAELAAAQVGVPYEAIIHVRGNVTPVFLFSVPEGTLPDGLTWEYHEHDDFAKITGTPVRAGTFAFKVSVSCLGTNVSGQSGEMEYKIEVR
jgi:hypothetical protein